MIQLGVEQLEPKTEIGLRFLPPEGFLPRNFKVCIDVEVPGQKTMGELEEKDRFKLGKKVAQILTDRCPGLGSILMTVDGTREGVVNIGVYADSLLAVNVLKDAEGIYPLVAFDISDPNNPKQLEKKEWLKK